MKALCIVFILLTSCVSFSIHFETVESTYNYTGSDVIKLTITDVGNERVNYTPLLKQYCGKKKPAIIKDAFIESSAQNNRVEVIFLCE